MSEHRPRRILVAAVATAVVLAGCSGDDDADDPEPTTSSPDTEGAAPSGTDAAVATAASAPVVPEGDPGLTFGFLAPGVGLLNELSIGQERGLTLAVDDINAAGGVFDAPVASVRAEESASSAIEGVVDDLLDQGADVLVGPAGSSSTATLVPTLAERGLVACSASATATSLTDESTASSFVRTALRDDYLATIVAEQLMVPADDSPPPATVTILGRDDVYGNELTGALGAELTARGAQVSTITYPARRVTFPDESAQVAAAPPDTVVLASFTEAPNLIAELAAAGYPVDRIVGLDGLLVPRLAEQTFPDDPTRANGLTVIGTTGDRALMARLAEVPAAQDQTSYGGQMYDCVITLALGAIMAGSADPARIGEQLIAVTDGGRTCSTFAHCAELLAAGEDVDYDGTTGRIDFDDAGDVAAARITTTMVIDGALEATGTQDLDLVTQRQEEVFAAAVFVTQLQQALKVLGYFEGDVTGVYDDATTAAVAALQRDLGLPDTGQFDEATDAALRERLGAGSAAFGTSVTQLQEALTELGYYTGPIDGRYSAATVAAVRAFQRDLGVPETGVIDVATLQAIYARGIQTGGAAMTTTTLPATTAPATPPPAPPPTTATTAPAPVPPPTAAPTAPPTAPPDTVAPPAPQPPDDLYTLLAADPEQFSTLIEVLDAAGYRTDPARAPITFFAPTNAAFDDATRRELLDDPEAADALLRNLAVEGAVPADQLETGTLGTIGADGSLDIVVADDGSVTVGGADVEPPEIVASNGIAHAIAALPSPG